MLRNINKASSSRIGKFLMATVMSVLAISFAIWGIGDIFRGGFGRNEVASVGSTDISVEQFRQYYNDQLQQLSRQARRVITPDQARAMGLGPRFLEQLIAQVTLDEQARKMHLGLSNAEIAARIKTDPVFAGANGQFDRVRFEQIIREMGYTEPRFVGEQRQTMLRQQIAQTVGGDVPVPSAAIAALNQFRNEKRDIDYIVLGPAQAGNVPAPMPDEVAKYYEAHKGEFRAPEYRKLTILPVSAAELANPAEVTEAQAKTYYEQHKNDYGRPEKRELHQIVFPDEAQAAAALKDIQAGATFQQIAEKRGLKPSDTDLGTVTKAQVIDPAIANAAFSLPVNQVSQPVKGRFGTVLVLVSKIEPGEEVSFQQVEPKIRQTLAEQHARGKLGDLRDKIEDEKASGATLNEVAQKLKLKAVTIDAVDRTGRGPNGEPVAALKSLPPTLVANAFASDVGIDNEAITLPEGGYVYYDVNGITPSHERPLDEVKPQVEARWRADEIAKQLASTSDEIMKKLKGGAALAQVATEHGATVQHAAGLERSKPEAGVPPTVTAAVFKTPKGGFGAAEGANPTERYVFQVVQVTDPAPDPIESAKLKSVLQNAYAEDLIGEYLTRLENEFGVTRNQTALNQVIGGTAEQ